MESGAHEKKRFFHGLLMELFRLASFWIHNDLLQKEKRKCCQKNYRDCNDE